MAAVKKGTNLTEEEFNLIKTLLNQKPKIKTGVIQTVTRRSGPTIRQVRDYADYQEYKKPKVVKKVPESVPTITKVLQNINESLLSLDLRMKWLEDNVPVEPKKKWFTGGRI